MRRDPASSRIEAAYRAAWLVVTALVISAATAFGGTNRFTAKIISQSEASTNLTRALWHPSGRLVSYPRPKAEGKTTNTVLWGYDVERREERVLFSPAAHRVSTNLAPLSLSSYQWSPSGDAILVASANDLWWIPMVSGHTQRLTQDAAAEELPTFSPDGTHVAFVKRNNLFVIDVPSGRARQLTFDGSDDVLNGKLDWAYGEEFSHLTGSARAYEWSPDGRKILYLRLDETPVPEYAITDFLRTHPTIRKQRYPTAGDPNPVPSVCVVHIGQPKPLARSMALDAGVEYVLPKFSWTPDSKGAAVMTLNRGQNQLTVRLWKTSWGKPRVLLRESDPCWINVFDPPRFLKDKRFLWATERDGWYHCYLYQDDGTLLRPLTAGPWQIEPVFSQSWSGRPYEIDAANEWAYFSATEKDPRERQLYRARIDGSNWERLTGEPGTHFQKLSPDGRYLLESFSSVDAPPSIRVRRADGMLVAVLDQRADRWQDYATASAEFHEVTAADGAKLYGQLTKPAGFDGAKRYPVIVYVYGG